MIEQMREHAETVGARGMPATRQILRDAASRIEALENELSRLLDHVSGEDAKSIAKVLVPDYCETCLGSGQINGGLGVMVKCGMCNGSGIMK